MPGDQRRINSTVQLRVTPLCVYCSVPPNTGQDPLIPPYLLSLISVAAFRYPTKRNVPPYVLLPRSSRIGRLGVKYEILISGIVLPILSSCAEALECSFVTRFNIIASKIKIASHFIGLESDVAALACSCFL